MGISCFMLFANELLLAVYFICILDYGILWIIEKDSEIQKKHLLLLYWLHRSLWLCKSQQTTQCSKFSKPGFNSTWTMNFQVFQVVLEKAEKPEINLPISIGSSKNIWFIDYAKAFDYVDHNKLWKIPKEMGIPDYLTCLLRNLYAGQEQQLESDMEQQTGSKSGKEYIKAIYCHPAYLTYMLGWMKHKLESRLPGEISITSDLPMAPHLRQKAKN